MRRPWIIAIPTLGRNRLLERTLRSLVSSGIKNTDALIVVVENGGTHRSNAIIQSLQDTCSIRYMSIKEKGKSPALNRIIDDYPNAFIWFLDDDVRVTEQAVRSYYEAFRQKRCGQEYYGGPLGVDYENPPQAWLVKYLPRSALGWTMDLEAHQQERPTFLGANWAAWADDLRSIGGFDPALGPGAGSLGDEPDVQNRLASVGLTPVYLADALVYHWVPKNRCSPAWVLRRAFLIGKTEGYHKPHSGPMLFRVPRWMYRELGIRMLRCLKRIPNRNRAERFEAQYELFFFLGWMLGVRRSTLEKCSLHSEIK